jgi:hypothetical protein
MRAVQQVSTSKELNEVTLRVVLELLDVVAFQQAVIKQFYEQDHVVSVNHNDQASEPEMSEVSQKIVEKLTQLREELDPVLKTVEDACQQVEFASGLSTG